MSRGRGRGRGNLSFPRSSANDRIQRDPQFLEENNNRMDWMDVDFNQNEVFPQRGRGGGRRGRRGGRASMNQTFPRQSANLRLQRFSQPLTREEVKETVNNNNRRDAARYVQNQEEAPMDRRPDAGIPGCICLRDIMRIFCESCGHADEGRLRKICPMHPRDVYLYDVTNCPKCRRPHVPGRKPRLLEFPLNVPSNKKLILVSSSAR